jgi:hypothetical protein
MTTYKYILLRYVPDPARMEPLNCGVAIEAPDGCIYLRTDPRFMSLPQVDAEAYAKWCAALTGEALHLSRSPKSGNLHTLRANMQGPNMSITEPLTLDTSDDPVDALYALYDRLVRREYPNTARAEAAEAVCRALAECGLGVEMDTDSLTIGPEAKADAMLGAYKKWMDAR